jgi:ubiquinone biosynthesis protein COQ9
MAPRTRLLKPLVAARNFRALQSSQSTLPSRWKAYHSYDHPSAPAYPPPETAILTASLKHIPTHGFTKESLTRGAVDAGYLPISTNLFPRGEFELVAFWCGRGREGLKERVDGDAIGEKGVGVNGLRKQWDDGKVGVGGRVRSLVLERLKMNAEAGIVERWQEVRSMLFRAIQKHISVVLLH